ncbi:DUF6153 family protein [Nocardia terpenica]|uniref:Uncharacterized protein n=1 Tax=Nocardia terpenica TaxID=455432 RepID=A0A6G9YVT0_9NOCA|nr:DUF6153 family protein [Nocardia terpenica]QIS17445.1 hypothetical protein F6W96_03120 [Nocardia terpenica]
MVEQRPPRGVSGRVRILGFLVLLFGVAAMHAGVLVIEPCPYPQAGSVDQHAMLMSEGTHEGATAPGPDHHMAHMAMHGCMFVLSMVALATGLVLLYRMAVAVTDGRGAGCGHWRARRARPPPWAVPSLAELSILRI